MLQSLHIENFRGFQEFDLENLGRINLLVGENNSGKTSILEALRILLSDGNLNLIIQLMNYRGEYLQRGDKQREYEFIHLFHGHINTITTDFLIRANDHNGSRKFSMAIKEKTGNDSDPMIHLKTNEDRILYEENNRFYKFQLERSWSINDSNYTINIPLLSNKTISINYENHFDRFYNPETSKFFNWSTINTRLITYFSSTIQDLTQLFDNIVLSPYEQLIIEALQILEPKIERIASVGQEKYNISSRTYGERGGFVVKFSDQNKPVPIGSLGDGIWRILSIILAMVNLENGVLLVDEIDTGLHFSTLLDMWEVILFTARKLNIQVFATTHNSDCWRSLAKLIKQEEIEENEITIQRIEPDRKKSVSFNTKQIVIAEERDIEVR
ncbi:AAA family ATPase [Crocosphaera sp.]|uniref:AAA family ATPase n=1 Tax=Crocosphaera sp. TaxID=2729996 RepID=UPI003F267468